MDTRWMPLASGILDIVTGALSLLGSLVLALVLGVYFSYDAYAGESAAVGLWLLLFVPLFIVSILAIVGGIFALRRKVWGLALAGSIGSILTLWAWPLGVASVVFISISKREFEKEKPLFPPGVLEK